MILRRDIFQAIADPTRRAILLLLASQTITAGAIADNFDNARSTVSKHIQILTECGLVESNQRGREIYYQINFERMAEIDLWLDQLRKIWENRFGNLESYLTKLQKKSKK
jgi:DNA-binding transcriptional ArsR family regulator